MIAVDNQAALRAFDSDLRKPAHHLAREALRLANQIQKRRSKRRYKLSLRWTAGHEGIAGNEKADAEAKIAASGQSSQPKHLPPYLRKPLSNNPAALRRDHNDQLTKDWKEEWRRSPRGKKIARIDDTTPSPIFLKTISNEKLSRKAASQIAQLRLRHFPLNDYLRKINRADSVNCPACREDNEDVAHFLLTCPSYAFERWKLTQQASKNKRSMMVEALLGEPKLAIAVAHFIESSGRFHQNLSESPPNSTSSTARENAQIQP
jgi:hypothetical protein